MNADQVKGRANSVKGKVEESAGKILNDKKLERKGKLKKNAGKIQALFGDLKDEAAKG
jgi:uncharacterized protein YjbJ (UPF0337 family)